MDDARFRSMNAQGGTSETVAKLLAQPIEIRLEAEPTWARQLCAIALTDLLGRTFPYIDLTVDPDLLAQPLLPPGPDTVLARMQQARGYALIDSEAATSDPVVTIVVGDRGDGSIFIDGDGWLSYLGEAPGALPAQDATNPIGPLAAACRGASQVVQRILGSWLPETSSVPASYWSALSLGPVDLKIAPNPPLTSPAVSTLLMGGGSIGGATVYALARVPDIRGNLIACDPDRLEARNSRKALLARRDDINARSRKVDVIVDDLAHTQVKVVPFEGTLAEWVATCPPNEPLPMSICAVDSIPARRELADHMPLDVINAACGDSHVVVSGHRTDDGPCVYCLYVREVLDAAATRARMIHRETGLPPGFIDQYRIKQIPLNKQALDAIAKYRRLPLGALDHRVGLTLDELFDEEFLYGEVRLADEEGDQADSTLQLTFVPALAGILLAGEALKIGDEALCEFCLGPGGTLGTEYVEALLQPPVGMLSTLPRWPTNECLCRSVRRLKLMRARHGLGETSAEGSES
jgi:hypothetical protein